MATEHLDRALVPTGNDVLPIVDGRVSLRDLWAGLRSGRLQVMGVVNSETHHMLQLTVRHALSPPPGFEALEALLADGARGAAVELVLAPSTVAVRVRECLAQLGVNSRPSRIAVVLALAYYADRWSSSARAAATNAAGVLHVAVPRVDAHLADLLPAGEFIVLKLLVEGQSYQQIAATRGTSVRTIANQVAAAFRRLKVSGRNELLERLARDSMALAGEHPAPLPAALPPRAELQLADVVRTLVELKQAVARARTAANGTRHEKPVEIFGMQVAVLEKQLAVLQSSIGDTRHQAEGPTA